jgi:hypothetical protein
MTKEFFCEDEIYDCYLCGKKLRYSGFKNAILEIGSDVEHICNAPLISNTTKPKEAYLSLQSHESKLAREYDAYFEDKKNTTDIRKQASDLERYNRSISYDKKQRMMSSNSNVEKKSSLMLTPVTAFLKSTTMGSATYHHGKRQKSYQLTSVSHGFSLVSSIPINRVLEKEGGTLNRKRTKINPLSLLSYFVSFETIINMTLQAMNVSRSNN